MCWIGRPARVRASVVHVSSLAAVGLADRPDEVMAEDAVVQPASARLMYAEHKREGERLALEAAEHGLPVTIACPGTVLGPWDHGRHADQLLRSAGQRSDPICAGRRRECG